MSYLIDLGLDAIIICNSIRIMQNLQFDYYKLSYKKDLIIATITTQTKVCI